MVLDAVNEFADSECSIPSTIPDEGNVTFTTGIVRFPAPATTPFGPFVSNAAIGVGFGESRDDMSR